MKKWGALLLIVLLCLSAICALADDYGTAVIDARNGDRVHLREEAAAESASMGLYFTGTEVKCLSEPGEEWVKVRIGVEEGYMKARYLKTGDAADTVVPRFRWGTVTAKNWGRLRRGPSTEYKFICKISNGESVVIMGETRDHWYYVRYGNEEGFISASLVEMAGETSVNQTQNANGWKQAYRDYVQKNANDWDKFSLIYVNDDDVPELAVSTGAEAGGCQILTYTGSSVDVLQTYRLAFTYAQRENRLSNSAGHMDYYHDYVYEIQNGCWMRVAYGECAGYKEGWSEAQGRYICENYVWNGRETTMEAYLDAYARVYPQQRAKEASFEYSYAEIMNVLR